MKTKMQPMLKFQMDNDPLGLLRLDLCYRDDPSLMKPLQITVLSPSQGSVESSLPFDEPDHRRITILKALNSYTFNTCSFTKEELKWMQQEKLLSSNGKAFHPGMRANIGKALYQTLFPPNSDTEKLLEQIIYARLSDQTARGKLHIQIGIESKNIGYKVRLLDYPWELLHNGKDFLARSGIEISRYINYGSPPPQLPLRDQINVLLVSSKAYDSSHKLEPLSDAEYQTVLKELKRIETTEGHICVQSLVNPTYEEFAQYLQDHTGVLTPHIIHFDGHGEFGSYCLNPKEDGDICRTFHPGDGITICTQCQADLPPPQGYLLFLDDEKKTDGISEYVSAEDIGSLIEQANQSNEVNQNIMLVVLSSCKSSMALGQDSIFNGIAQNLISHQIAAVVGMAFTVRASSATHFAGAFYRALDKRLPLTVAMSWGRRAMKFSLNQWYRPTLYLRGLNNTGGQIFDHLVVKTESQAEYLQQNMTPQQALREHQDQHQTQRVIGGKQLPIRGKAINILPMEIFYSSYSHEDETLRENLETHLSLLKQQADITTTWHNYDTISETEWEQEINKHLNTAKIILLLISPNFMRSDYCSSKEMTRAVERHESGEACVIPIILRPCNWREAPFGKLQVLPRDAKPMTTWSDQDEALLDVVEGIREAIKSLRLRLSPVSTQPPSKIRWIVPSYYPHNPSFTDRRVILSNLRNAFTAGKAGTLIQQVVGGLNGMGKTQCALEYAYHYRNHYRTVLWANATSQETLFVDFVNIALELHLLGKDAEDQTFADTAVKHWLTTNTSWLLILDNADDLDLISSFLPSEGEIEGEGHILITTSSQIHSPMMKHVKIEEMDKENGILFLLRRAQFIATNATLDAVTTKDRTIASEIVRELGGVPLALDQAGAYISETKCGLSHYLQLYRTRHAALLKRRSALLPYPVESVAATWNLAVEKVRQINPAAVDLLHLCTFLAPDAIPEEIISEGAPDLGPVFQPVATDPLKLDAAIIELLKYSLIDRDGETLTIQHLLPTVLQDEMDENTRRHWAECAVRAVNRVFPKADVTTWSLCQRYISQAQKCAELIKGYDLLFLEAGRLLYEAGQYLFVRAQYAQAELLYRQALEIRKQVTGTRYPDTARILHGLAKLYLTKHDYIPAMSLYQEALEIRKQVPGTEYLDTASILHELASLYHAQDQYKQAKWLIKEAEDIYEQVLGAKGSDAASALCELAWVYRELNTYEQAETLYQEALKISKQVLGTEHPDTARILHDLAWFYQDRGQYAKAERLYKQALEIRGRVLGPHDQTADTLHALAWFYRKQDKYKQAKIFYQQALKMRKQVFRTRSCHSEYTV